MILFNKNFMLSILLCLSVLIANYLLNIWTPLLADDYSYSWKFASREPITNLYDIVYYQYQHYLSWGGRVVNHAIDQIFLLAGKNIFNIVNSVGYVILILLIYFHSVGKNKLSPILLLFIIFSLLQFVPAWGQSFLWITGSSNYMWSCIIVLIFLIPFRLQFDIKGNITNDEPSIKNPVFIILYGAFGIIAGWTNENMTVGLFVMVIAYMWLFKNQVNFIPTYMKVGAIACFIGAAALIAAPGNQMRMKIENTHVNIIKNIGDLFRKIIKLESLLLPVTLLIAIKKMFASETKEGIWKIYLLGAVISHFSMIASPYYPNRAMTSVVIFLIITICNLIALIDFSKSELKKLTGLTIIFMLLITVQNYRNAYKDIKSYYYANNDRIEYLKSEKEQGKTSAKINPVSVKTKQNGAYDNEYWVDRTLIVIEELQFIEDSKK